MVPDYAGPPVRPRTVLVSLASIALFGAGGYLGAGQGERASVSAAFLPVHVAPSAVVATPVPSGRDVAEAALGTELDVLRRELASELVDRAVSMPSGYPVRCPLSSKWGMRMHPKRKKRLPHHGVDLGCPVGTVVRATADGTVLGAGEGSRSGRWLRIVHAGGYGTVYAHLDTVLVEKGQAVAIGDTVALSGESGDVTGPHLHYEVNWGGRRSDSLSLPINALAPVRDSLLAEAEQLVSPARQANSSEEAPNP
jgi:murein DD-endopeptidase MepM/ murein hydrolase activator NlpD